jgi:predicted N-acetyltransferase YhbS
MAAGEFHIRAGRSEDFARLQAIEIDSFESLREAGGVSGDAIASTDDELQGLLRRGLLLVAADKAKQPIGYVGAAFSDGWLHVAEIDVARAWQRQGVGRALMQAVLAEGRARGLSGATLTTDRLVPFNAPFYASLGFRLLGADELPQRLRNILEKEHAAGLDPARRVAMKLDFSTAAS